MSPASYVRLFSDSEGASHFEACTVALAPGFAVPPAEPLHVAPFVAGDGATFWMGAPADWRGSKIHPAPRRLIFITVAGEYEVTVSDGSSRRFPAGSVLLIEDTEGRGHSTRITSAEAAFVFAVGLPDAIQDAPSQACPPAQAANP